MSFGGGGGSPAPQPAPRPAPKPAPVITPPPAKPKTLTPEVLATPEVQSVVRQRKRRGTALTGPRGIEEEARTRGKTLLGA